MAKANWNQYSATAASNTDIDSINIDEGMAPSNVNNAIRELMAHTADVVAGTTALSSINIDGGSITGITDLAVADGGTGSSTASGARTNLGLGDAATKTVGTSNGNVIAADATGIPAINGSQVTALNASNLGSGTVPTARLGSGTASSSTFLRGDSTYAEVGGAGLTLLGTGTASGSASLAFTSLMSSTYTTYLMIFEALLPATNGAIAYLYLSEDNGSSYTTSDMRYIVPTTFYAGSGSPSGNGGNTEASGANFWQLTGGALSNAANQGMSGHVWIFDTQNNSSLSRMRGSFVYSSDTTHNQIAADNVYGNTVSATDKDAIKVQMSSGNIASGKVKLYGVIAT
mgnify:CR=1 FL=1